MVRVEIRQDQMSLEVGQLKDLVSRTLEAKGVLGIIRAQLRASVFSVLDEQERQSGVFLGRSGELRVDLRGNMLSALLQECMEHYDLSRTLSVFAPEANWNVEAFPGRESLMHNLGISAAEVSL